MCAGPLLAAVRQAAACQACTCQHYKPPIQYRTAVHLLDGALALTEVTLHELAKCEVASKPHQLPLTACRTGGMVFAYWQLPVC